MDLQAACVRMLAAYDASGLTDVKWFTPHVESVRDALSGADEPVEAAHSAYHEHNQKCACRTVGHLTAWIAHRVIGIEPPAVHEYFEDGYV